MKILFITDLYPIIEDKTIPKIVEDFALAFKEKNNDIFVIRPNFLLNSFLRKHPSRMLYRQRSDLLRRPAELLLFPQ